MSDFSTDPVACWLAELGVPERSPSHRVGFDLPWGRLAVASNDELAILASRSYFIQYPQVSPLAPDIQTEISLVRGSVEQVGLSGPFPPGMDPPTAPVNSFEGTRYLHMIWPDRECLWRPRGLLASFSSRPEPLVRLLIAAPPEGEQWVTDEKMFGQTGVADLLEAVQLTAALFLRFRGVYGFHAAALALGRQGVLLVGASGSGKTTTALTLAYHGLSLLSDEIAVVSGNDGAACRINGLLLPPKVVGMPLASMDELADRIRQQDTGENKSACPLPKAGYSLAAARNIDPKAIFFLSGRFEKRSSLKPVGEQQAFVLLMEQMLDPTMASRMGGSARMALRLVQQAHCWMLTPGQDLKALNDLIQARVWDLS